MGQWTDAWEKLTPEQKQKLTPEHRSRFRTKIQAEFDAPGTASQQQPTAPGGFQKFTKAAWETLDPMESVGLAYSILTSPPWSEENPYEKMVKGMAAMHGERYEKFRQDPSVLRGAAAFTPMFGPMGAEIAEEIADPETRATGLGHLAGILTPAAITKVGKRIRPKVVIAGQEAPKSIGERLRLSPVRKLERIMEASMPGSGPFGRLRTAQQVYFSDRADAILKLMSSTEGTSRQFGDITKDLLEAEKRTIKDSAQVLYGNIDEQVASKIVRVPTTKTVPVTGPRGPVVDIRGEPLTAERRVLEKQLQGGVQPSTRSLRKVAVPLLRDLRESMIPTADKGAMMDQLIEIRTHSWCPPCLEPEARRGDRCFHAEGSCRWWQE
jgi:hypothetical protein